MLHVTQEEDVTCVQMDIYVGGQKTNTVYTFLVDGMLIDTGPQSMENEMVSFYREHDFDLVALTHHDEDHTGTAPWIQKNRDVPIYIHPKFIDVCKKPYPYPEYRQFIWGKRDSFDPLPIGDMIQSRNREWQVIYTPGHADDHVSFFDPHTGTMFSGDLYVAPKTKVIMERESIPQIMRSIEKLLQYDFDSLFCCHAGYVNDGKKMLQKKLDYLENLSGEVKERHKKGHTIEEITQEFFPKNYAIITASGGEWDSRHIISSILSDME